MVRVFKIPLAEMLSFVNIWSSNLLRFFWHFTPGLRCFLALQFRYILSWLFNSDTSCLGCSIPAWAPIIYGDSWKLASTTNNRWRSFYLKHWFIELIIYSMICTLNESMKGSCILSNLLLSWIARVWVCKGSWCIWGIWREELHWTRTATGSWTAGTWTWKLNL